MLAFHQVLRFMLDNIVYPESGVAAHVWLYERCSELERNDLEADSQAESRNAVLKGAGPIFRSDDPKHQAKTILNWTKAAPAAYLMRVTDLHKAYMERAYSEILIGKPVSYQERRAHPMFGVFQDQTFGSEAQLRRYLEDRGFKLRPAAAGEAPRTTQFTPEAFARLVGLPTGPGSHTVLKNFAGADYFVLRLLVRDWSLSVAHLRIDQDPEAEFPATFVTDNLIESLYSHEPYWVEGIIYMPVEYAGLMNDPPPERLATPSDDYTPKLFSVGSFITSPRSASTPVFSTQIRSEVFEPVRKPAGYPDSHLWDLRGIRLGLSRRPERMPRAGRIWCARLPAAHPDKPWINFTGQYRLEKGKTTLVNEPPEFLVENGKTPQDFFESTVSGLGSIIEWLVEGRAAELAPARTSSAFREASAKSPRKD
jgi:hypothetical protein